MAEKIATRHAYGQALAELGKEASIVALDADVSTCTMSCDFGKQYPGRFVNVGIAEANMVGIAAGLSTLGYIPFLHSFAMFTAGRCFEQIRNTLAYPNLNVKVVGTHAGLSVGEDGATHQCLEDISIMRTIPGMPIVHPCDGNESREGTIIAVGMLVQAALKAAATLEKEGISVRVLNMHTIKPLDTEAVVTAAKETGVIITAEEHNIIGGLGSAVAEAVTSSPYPVPVYRVGSQDTFGQSGNADALMEYYGLTETHVAEVVREAVQNKAK